MSFETELNANEATESEGNSCTTMIFSGNLRKQTTESLAIASSKTEESSDFGDSFPKMIDSNNATTTLATFNGTSSTIPQPECSIPETMPISSSQFIDYKKNFCGLKNLGNTCYANSCLQALYITNKLRRHLLKRPNNGQLHVALSKLYTIMDKMSQRVSPNQECPIIKPEEFLNEFRLLKPQFVRHEQHDAQEFLSILLESVHQEANQAKKDNTKNIQIQLNNAEEAWNHHIANVDNSYYSRLFVGQIESSLKCLTCDNISLSWSCFWQIPLYLNNVGNNFREDCQRTLTVENCIKEYTASEILSDDCAPMCEKCNQRRASSMQQTICRLPHYLIVHLKRFTHTGTKISRKVTINPVLKLCNKTFAIYACVLHRGTESVGHYYTLSNVNHEWILFDDESILKDFSDSHAEALLQDYAYICFYKAVSKTNKGANECQASNNQ